MKVLIPTGKTKNILATIAIGDSYYGAWEKYALPGWRDYCNRHDLGLVAFDEDLISKADKKWKKATWQKLLIGETIINDQLDVHNVCYLDTDILISPLAPNIFQTHNSKNIGLVSVRKNLPYPYDQVLRRMAYLRNTHYSKEYPLDSSLFISLDQLFKYHNLPVQSDEACMGLILFNTVQHSKLMRGWFDKYDQNMHSVTNGGDQTHVNFEIQNYGNISWLDYRFQAIWLFEMAWKYPFLYDYGKENLSLINECIESSLYANYFLHFAGSWHESSMWKLGNLFTNSKKISILEAYKKYIKEPVTGLPKGQFKPR